MPKSADKPMRWTAEAERALALAFEGRWTQEEIVARLAGEDDGSAKFRITTRTLRSWLAHPEFKARLAQMRADFAASIAHVTYADKARRIVALDAMAEAARREFEARPWLREVRPTPKGDVTNEHFNAEAHAAFRGALDDIAKELGHRRPERGDGADAAQVRIIIETDTADAPGVAVAGVRVETDNGDSSSDSDSDSSSGTS